MHRNHKRTVYLKLAYLVYFIVMKGVAITNEVAHTSSQILRKSQNSRHVIFKHGFKINIKYT